MNASRTLRKFIAGFLFLPFLFMSCREKQHTIRSFYVEHSGTEGECPNYKMGFHQDRTVTYLTDCGSRRERFTATLLPLQYDSLLSLLNASSYPTLSETYQGGLVDNGRMVLTIMYDQNQIKRVKDEGEKGTPHLQTLYRYINQLRENQNWQRVR